MGKDVRVQKQHYDRSRNLQDYGLIDNSKNIQKVINSFKYTIEYSIENDELNEDNLAAVFIENIKAEATVIDMSSVKPNTAKFHGTNLKSKNINYLDAPVSGGTI
ncbi:NAD(P)-binding domain-containing protein, partial [Mesonia mobilis]|uniref:NAD(P)-binding domain-containing protein n=1 Tax=Mesonia mobilis TaxID=369791 RepID=UPI0026F25288